MSLSKMNACKIYKTKDEFIVVTSSKTDDWIVIDDEPIFKVPIKATEEELVKKIRESITSSRNEFSTPSRDLMEDIQKNNLKKMGQKSYNDLYVKSSLCSVEEKNNVFFVTPYEFRVKGKPSQGLAQIKEKQIEVDMTKNDISILYSAIIKST